MNPILKHLNLKRAQMVGDKILPLIEDGDSVLDFGCGSMVISKYISSKRNIDLTGVDVIDIKIKDARYVKYDGGKLPFEDNQFDVVIAIFVLHHTDNPDFFLNELRRVSKKKIILCEDTYTNEIGKIVTKLFDWICNVPFRSCVGKNFKSILEWKYLFKKNILTLMTLKRIYLYPIPFLPIKNVIMELKK